MVIPLSAVLLCVCLFPEVNKEKEHSTVKRLRAGGEEAHTWEAFSHSVLSLTVLAISVCLTARKEFALGFCVLEKAWYTLHAACHPTEVLEGSPLRIRGAAVVCI